MVKISKALVFSDVNLSRGAGLSDYTNYKIEFGDISNYEILAKIGGGRYSVVYDGNDVRFNRRVVIKILKPIKSMKIKREVKILSELRGGDNIVQLLDVVINSSRINTSLIFESIANAPYDVLFRNLDFDGARWYFYQVVKALYYCHSHGVMHRDVKLSNILCDPRKRVLKLADWGLAEYYYPGQEYNVSVASKNYKGPELLLNYQYYDYSLDIWSLGCTMAAVFFETSPFFAGENNDHQLVLITKVLGFDNLSNYLEKYDLNIKPEIQEKCRMFGGCPLEAFAEKPSSKLVNDDVLNVLYRMLVFDHQERITAIDLMKHTIFDVEREG